MNTFDPNAKYIVTPFADLKLYNQAYDILKKMTKGNEFRILSIEPDEFDNIKSVTVQECGEPRIHTIRLSQREIDAFISLVPKRPELIDFDVADICAAPIKPLEIKEPTMTINTSTTYSLKSNNEINWTSTSNTTCTKLSELKAITQDKPFTIISVNYSPIGASYRPMYLEIKNSYGTVSTFTCYLEDFKLLVKEIKETTMTIEAGKTYVLTENLVQIGNTCALNAGWRVLKGIFGFTPFTVLSVKFNHNQSFFEFTAVDESGNVCESIIFPREFILLEEVEEQDPTDLLTHAVAIETPFKRVCGWVTDQWVEDGVELLNVVHAGDFSVVPRSAVVNVLN